MRVYVARHGETTWNVIGRYQGRKESQLSELGVRQAYALVTPMQQLGVKRVLSSPLMRCVASAAPIANALRVPIELDERLVEIAHGTWEGRFRDELAANDPERYKAWREDPANAVFEGGERVLDVLERWKSFASDFSATAPSLVMTHDVVVRLAVLHAANGSLQTFWHKRVANCAFATFEVKGTSWTLLEECSVTHLDGIIADQQKQAL